MNLEGVSVWKAGGGKAGSDLESGFSRTTLAGKGGRIFEGLYRRAWVVWLVLVGPEGGLGKRLVRDVV